MTTFNPNIIINGNGFWVRWTLLAFISINIALWGFVLYKKHLCKKNQKESIEITFSFKKVFIPMLLYIATIPIYYFRNALVPNDDSVIYKSATYLNSIEIIVALFLAIILIYGFVYKNYHTFINLYFKILAILEIIYITSYYITNQVTLNRWFNWVGVVLLGIVFVLLCSLNIVNNSKSKVNKNLHNAINEYNLLFSKRKYQADEIIDLIESPIDEGYSICLNGEWGSGKTSLVNSLLDKTKNNNHVDICEVRINAMELDNTASLMSYLLDRIEEILKSKNIYVGIASEYKDLVASISGTIIHKSIGTFIAKKLNNDNNDYRENIKRLSQLLLNNLKDSKIIIVIDDIERCSAEKAKSFLFLIKEIATMNRCLTIFLADIEKLKIVCDLEDVFFEKFFNCTISLTTVEYNDMFSIYENVDECSVELFNEINIILTDYDRKIKEVSADSYLYINDYNERLEYKKNKIQSIQEYKNSLLYRLTNPRRMVKIIEYYSIKNDKINAMIKNSPTEEKSSIIEFLNKVNYKKQLTLLAIINSVFCDEFGYIKKHGTYKYIDNLKFKIEHKQDTEQNSRQDFYITNSLLENEWYSLLFTSNFMNNEKLRFVECVLTNIDDLSNIANGFTSIDQKYISMINSDILPEGIEFPDLVYRLYNATCGDIPYCFNILEKAFNIYRNKFPNNQVDIAFNILSEFKHPTFEIQLLKLFSEVFCVNNNCLCDPVEASDKFKKFAHGYLWINIVAIRNYLIPISDLKNVSYDEWNKVNECFFLKETCTDMINAFCEQCEKYLKFKNTASKDQAIIRLNNLIKKAKQTYQKLDMLKSPDVIEVYKNVEKTIDEIGYLFKIESFINKRLFNQKNTPIISQELSIDNVSAVIDSLYDKSFTNAETIDIKDIQAIFHFIYNNEITISCDTYNKLNDIVSKLYNVNKGGIPFFRQMLVYIKQNKIG